jgi:hypothetical protein
MAEDEQKERQVEDPRYTVTIDGPGVRVEQSVPKGLLPQLLAMLVNADNVGRAAPTASTPQAVSLPATAGPLPPMRTSLAEYLEEINARRIPERILGMANYITEVTGQQPDNTFTKSDIRPCFKAAGDPMPANFARDWQLVVSAGWVAEEPGNPDVFFVTRRGKTAIGERFSGEGDRITRIRRRRRVGGAIVTESVPADDQSEEDQP